MNYYVEACMTETSELHSVTYSLYVVSVTNGTTVEEIFTSKISEATMYNSPEVAARCMEEMRDYLGGFYGVTLELHSITDEDLFRHRLAGT